MLHEGQSSGVERAQQRPGPTRAQAGETIIITDRGRPIADLVPHTSAIRFADRDHVLADLTGLVGDSYAELRAQLDALADPYFDVERV